MTTTLATMKDGLRTMLGRGASLDGSLFRFISRAVDEIERTKKFNYMYTLFEVTNDPNAALPRALRIPTKRVRSIDFMRITEQDDVPLANAQIMRQVYDTPRMDPPRDDAIPTQFLLIRAQLIILNNTPQYTYTFEGGWWEYSALVDDGDFEHWLFENFEDGLLDFAAAQAAKTTRDYERANALLAGARVKLGDLIASAEDQDLDAADMVMRQDFYADDWPRSPVR